MKKRLAILFMACSLCFSAFAGKIYVSPSLFVQDISANASSFRGLHPRLSLGYSDRSRKVFMAAEVFIIPATLTLSDNRNPGATSTRISSSYGASILPGRRLYNDIWGFGRLGLINSKFSSPNISKMGTQLGLGLQSDLCPNILIRGEYIYTFYNGSVPGIGTANSNELGLGLSYSFDN